jgi:predicted MFS family arabinose efflux permease
VARVALGASWCFGLNGVSFIAVISSLLIIHPHFVPTKSRESVFTSMKEGIHFIRSQSAMEALIVLAFLMTLLAFPLLVFLPVFAKDVFNGGPNLFTIFLVCSGLGSICGAFTVAWLGKHKHMGLLVLLMLLVLGMLIAGFALSRNFALSCVLIFFAGAMLLAVFTSISSLVQLIAPDNMRGRVISVYNVAFRGGLPVGSLVVGALIKQFTAPLVLTWNGGLLTLLALYFLLVHRKVATL